MSYQARVQIRLKARETADGVSFVRDEVPLGKTYWVVPGSHKIDVWFDALTDKRTERLTIWAYSSPTGWDGGWYPVELLEMEEGAA